MPFSFKAKRSKSERDKREKQEKYSRKGAEAQRKFMSS